MAEIPLMSPQATAAAKPDFESQLNLENEAKDEVKKRKVKVGSLISEVEDLKKKCEKYANLINSEPDLE